MSLLAGTAKVNITPPIGCYLSGYAARNHGAEGINDELWARVLYLANEETEVALVAVEIIGLPGTLVDNVRQRVAAEVGMPAEHLFLSAIHTHSGPTLGRHPINERYAACLEDKLVGAVGWARRNRQPAGGIRVLQESVQCGVNRRERRGDRIVLGVNPQGPVYPYVDILQVLNPAGDNMAVWFCHPCHAVVMGQANYIISGDYPGAACRFVESNTGAPALFANGCAGNINSEAHNATFADVERLGRRLGAAVVQALTLPQPEITALPQLSAQLYNFTLPVEPVPPVAEAERQVEEARQAGKGLQDAEARLALAREGKQAELPVTVQVVTIGDTAILGLPGEIFIELAYAIQASSPFARTIVAGYTRDLGYIPVKEAFAEGGYEVERAIARRLGLRVTPDAGEKLVRESLRVLQEHFTVVKANL